jgi:hypothetical protein
MAAVKNVDWSQMGQDCKLFARRFATADFALIHPGPGEQAAVAGHTPRMASLIVWRRALLFMAAVLSVILAIKSCFDSHTYVALNMEQQLEAVEKNNPLMSPEERRKQAQATVDQEVKAVGEANVAVMDTLLVGSWLTIIASAVFLVLAARAWRDWKSSRKFALIAVAVVLLPQLLALLFPWASLMDFSHLERQFAAQGMAPAEAALQLRFARLGFQSTMAVALLATALPFIYSLFNGVLRATLTAKTLIPASIVCGWSTLLLAITIAVPWFCVLSIVDQFQLDALIILGVLCLLAAPLSLVLKCRRLGAALLPAEASPVVKRARLIFSGLNIFGALMIVAYLLDKDMMEAETLVSAVLQYFAQLMLITVVAVDWLVFLLERAHRKLVGNESLDESLQQLGEVLHPAGTPHPAPHPVT